MHRARTLVVAVAIAALFATGCEWRFETLDGNGGANGQTVRDVGRGIAAAVVYNGQPHVFYNDHDDNALRHAYFNGSFWAFETLDGNGGPNGRTPHDVGNYVSAVLYNGRPHVFYDDAVDQSLRHAWYNGIAWSFEDLDGDQNGPHGQSTHPMGRNVATILYGGRPHVFYEGGPAATQVLRHGWYNGIAWSFETLDGEGGAHGRTSVDVATSSNAVVVYNGRPHVFYREGVVSTDGNLRHAYFNGSFWAFETLDGNGAPHGGVIANLGTEASVVLYNARPHVFYNSATGENIRHAYYNGSFWAFETLDGNGGPNGRTANVVGGHTTAVLYGGKPQVFYRMNAFNVGDLRRAWFDGAAWHFVTDDGAGGGNGRTTNVVGEYAHAARVNGFPHVFYFDRDGEDLRHAWFG